MLPPLLPLFPLPTVVLFPDVFLPLHIFEPRYKQMVTRALEGDRIIGMTLLKPGLRGGLRGAAADLRASAAPGSSRTSSGRTTAAST